VGIGRKRIRDRPTDELALIFYVERKGEGSEPVPATIEFAPSGRGEPVVLATDVVETPPVQPEGETS
jgi:hypothetical protein